MTRWFAVATRPTAEYVALIEMQRVGLTCYLPQFRKEYRHHRSKTWIRRQFPLFDGYLFVAADDFDYGAMQSCRGLERDCILRDGERKPLTIEGAIIAEIRQHEATGDFDELRTDATRLHKGEPVLIADGIFSGMGGVLERVKSRRNVQLLMTMFNAQVKASGAVGKLARSA